MSGIDEPFLVVGLCQKCERHRTLGISEVADYFLAEFLGKDANQIVCGIEQCNGIIKFKGNYSWDNLPTPCWDASGNIRKRGSDNTRITEFSSKVCLSEIGYVYVL